MRGVPITLFIVFILVFVLITGLNSLGMFRLIKKRRHFLVISVVLLLYLVTIIAVATTIYGNPEKIRLLKDYSGILTLNAIILGTALTLLTFSLFVLLSQTVARFFRGYRKQAEYIFLIQGVILSALFVLLFVYGTVIGKHNVRYTTVELQIPDLPEAFDGLKLVHITDFHAGTFTRAPGWMKQFSNRINAFEPDFIFFTGDFVNNFSDELPRFVTSFKQLKARYGKYSITGNHDYGDYSRWENTAEKRANYDTLISYQAQMGFKVLLNSSDSITLKNKKLHIVGVENWGKPPFPKYGNLTAALSNSQQSDFTILLSHDPTHWEAEVWGYPEIALTLSGHTHGMQSAINTGGFRFSLANLIYKYWGGLYRHNNQFLYVSTGMGNIGFPGRIGLSPEITFLVLKHAQIEQE